MSSKHVVMVGLPANYYTAFKMMSVLYNKRQGTMGRECIVRLVDEAAATDRRIAEALADWQQSEGEDNG